MKYIFNRCSSLSIIPDISKWNISDTYSIESMFSECLSLPYIPVFSKFNTDEISYISYSFHDLLNCNNI